MRITTVPGYLDHLRLPTLSVRGRMLVTGSLAVIALVVLTWGATNGSFTTRSPPVDFSTFGEPGALILTGHWSAIFANPVIQAGPLELAFWGVADLIGISNPAGWATFCTIAGAMLMLSFVLVTERPLRAIAGPWSTPLATAIATLAVCSSGPNMALLDGHPAQLAIPILWLAAASSARAGCPFVAGLLLGVTTGWEVWGLLGAPVLLLAPRLNARVIVRSAVGVVAVAAVIFAPFILLGPFQMFEFSWHVSDRSLAEFLFPGATSFPWPLRLAQGVLSVCAGIGVALSLRFSVHSIWLAPLAVCSVRLLLDPVLAGYYTVAPVTLVLVGLVFCAAQRSFLGALACLAVLNALIDFLPLTVPALIAIVLLIAATFVIVFATEHRAAARPSGLRP